MTFVPVRRLGAALGAALLVLVLTPSARAAQTLHLSPAGATSVVHTTHTMIATLVDGGNAVVGARIIFSISGPNAGIGGTCVPANCHTDANGQVHFSYVGEHPGTDTVHAFVDAIPNGVQDPSEEDVDCTAKWTCGCSVSTTTTTTTSTTTTTTPPANFQCLEVKNFQFAPIRNVPIADVFGQSSVDLTRPNRLCMQATCVRNAPVTRAATTVQGQHYLAYPNQDSSFAPVRNVDVSTPYGNLKIDVLQPDFVMIPSAAHAGDTTPAPLVGPLPDSFQCHRIQAARGTGRAAKINDVTVTDGFGSYVVDLIEPHRLCAPADVSDGSPGAPDHASFLLCWRSRTRTNFGDARMTTKDAYGTLHLRLIRRLEVCAPATILP
jgi:hypothetical protein